MLKKIALCAVALLIFPHLYAQLEKAAFTEAGRGAVNAFATDYQCLGINPANMAYGNRFDRKAMAGFAQWSFSNYGEGFTRSEILDIFRGPGDELSMQEQVNAASRFANSAVALDLSVLLAGFSLSTERAGHFAFSIGARVTHFSRFNANAASQLWQGFVDPYFDQWVVPQPGGGTMTIPNGGPNSPLVQDVIVGIASNPQSITSLYDGSEVRTMGYMEYQVGYSNTLYRGVDVAIHGGIGIKYLQGHFLLDIAVEDQQLTRAFMAHTPIIDFDFGEAARTNPSAVSGSGLRPVGDGWGVDLGMAMEIGEKWRVSASVTDIGSITFDGNVYTVRDTLIFDTETTGISSFDPTDQLDAFSGRDGLFPWEGVASRSFNLPTQLRLGFGYLLSDRLQFGLDVALPFNDNPGNIERLGFAAGMDYIPSELIRLSGGIAAGDNYGFRVPLGINFSVGEGAWEFGVATRDALFYIRDDRPNISLAMGFLRFRFGEML